MTGQALRRVDHLLDELIELVETARGVPMSGSCVVPREQVLDLLDELRDVVPPEVAEAHRVLSRRDALLAEAEEISRDARTRADTEAGSIVDEARRAAHELVSEAEVRAHETVEAGKAEHAELVSASRVYQSAGEASEQVRADADEYGADVRADADAYQAGIRNAAEQYAAGMRTDAESFADRTLADLISVLRQATVTAEQGRQALAERRDGEPVIDHE